ncbi:MAG: glycosyltransferase family 39 protein [Bryobacterales bacterium]|nr:glycosyltransferase family 39 protein [Bryobacterales bacterium]
MKIAEKLEIFAESLAGWLERHRLWFLTGFSLYYFAAAVRLAKSGPFWFDELFTYYIARQSSAAEIIASLRIPVDQQPPPFYILTHAASRLAGDVHIGFRLPEILGVWLMCVCLFLFVARRTNALYGAFAMLTPLSLTAFFYAVEARPYGLVVGFCALALLAWQSAADGRRRMVWLPVLALALAAGISSSYYAVLLLAPFGLGELVRTVQRKAVDWGIWLAFGAGGGISFLYLPLVTRAVGGYLPRNWASPSIGAIFTMYGRYFEDAIVPLVALVAGLSLLLLLSGSNRKPESLGNWNRAFPHEIAAGIGLLLLPILGCAVAALHTKMITGRYVLSTILGITILFTLIAFRAARGSAAAGTVLFLVALGSVVAYQVPTRRYELRARRESTGTLRTLLANQPADLPVVVNDPARFFEASHYQSPEIASRLFFLVDLASSKRYGKIPYAGRGMLEMQRIAPVQVQELAAFRKARSEFLVYWVKSDFEFVLAAVVADGASVQLVAAKGGEHLYLVKDRR